MFGINGGEFFLIGIVALLVLGPERLPILARRVGKWTREMRSIATEFRSGIERELGGNPLQDFKDEIDKPISDLRSTLSDVRKDFNQASDGVERDLKAASKDVNKGLAWTGPVASQGPTPEDAAADLARIEAGEDLLSPGSGETLESSGLDDIELGADLDD
jgi:sec-independent protein translocase protein TatB